MTKRTIIEGLGRKEAELIAILIGNGVSVFNTEDAHQILETS